jgi:hypothetical protein
MRAYFRDASRESSSDLAPVTTDLPRRKNKRGRFGVANTHDDGGETLRQIKVAHALATWQISQ